MIIQFNLLPDVKKEYVKAKRTKRLIITFSIFASSAAIAVVAILFSIVQIGQKGHISRLTEDIQKYSEEIKQTENLQTMLSVQNQLPLLTNLHLGKPETSRLFDYVSFFAPKEVKYQTLTYARDLNNISISGTADSLATVNTLVSNIKAMTYYVEGEDDQRLAPYEDLRVELSGDNSRASFSLDFKIDPVILDNTKEIVMKLGDQTRSTKLEAN